MMSVIPEIISGFVLALGSAMLFVKNKISRSESQKDKPSPGDFIFSFAVYLASDITMIILMHYKNGLFDCVSIVMLANIMFILAVIDMKKKIIPNRFVLAMLIMRILSASVYGFFTQRFMPYIIMIIAGAGTGFIIPGIISLISKKSLGAGDVKMYTMIGAVTGITGVMDILIYTAVFCAVTGLILIAMKKCTFKSSLPMAPFACAGTILYIFLGCV